MKRVDGAYMTLDELADTIAKLDETIRQQRIQLDRKDDYIRKLESAYTRVESGSWERGLDEYAERLGA
jgi:hypothetical protein